MVLMLQEADDPDAKLSLSTNSPSVNRFTIDEHSELATSEDSDRETTALIVQDPPPSYIDVQAFRRRLKLEDEMKRVHRARRRFGLALAIALLLVALPTITGLVIRLLVSSQNGIPQVSWPLPQKLGIPFRSTNSIEKEPEPTPTPSSSSPPVSPPWRGGPPGRGKPGGPNHDHDHDHEHGGPPPWFPDEGRKWPGKGRWPERPPEDSEGDVICSDWLPYDDVVLRNDHKSSFVTTYSMSFNGSISIRSFLSQAVGTLRVSLDESLQPQNATIRIAASGIGISELKDVSACLSIKPGRSSSLSLKAKGPSAELATYSILLSLPMTDSPYPGLTTDLPRFAQSFDDLSLARFAYVDLTGVEGDVSSVFLLAKYLSVRTSNGSINGHFSADKRLDISGDIKPITITSDICDDGQGFPAIARITSSQSPINAKVRLCEPIHGLSPNAESGDYGRYKLYVANADSPISLDVEHAAPAQGSSLYLNVTNTETGSPGIAHTMVTLDTGFEGNFEVCAVGGGTTPVSIHSEDATDGQGGIRYVEIQKVTADHRTISGKVFWDSPAPRRASEVWINTSGEGEASLTLPGD